LYIAQSFDEATSEDLSINRVEDVLDYLIEIKTNYALNVLMIGMLSLLSKPPID
jgi:hypothetical protein